MSQVNNTTSLSEILDTIDLGPTGSVQMMFAKLQLAQSEICKNQAEAYMDQIEQIQAEQEECARMIEMARKLQNEASSQDASSGKKTTEMPAEMVAYFEKYGLTEDSAGGDHYHYKEEWDVNIKSLTNHQETIGNKTQTLMVYLQDFIGQYNSYLQGANTQIANANQTLTNLARGQ